MYYKRVKLNTFNYFTSNTLSYINEKYYYYKNISESLLFIINIYKLKDKSEYQDLLNNVNLNSINSASIELHNDNKFYYSIHFIEDKDFSL